MTTHAKGQHQMKTWDEKPYNEGEGLPKLTRASVTNVFTGDIEGESTLEYLMTYPDESHASYVGLERVTGRIGTREGTFVLEHRGNFEGTTATTIWNVVSDSATGDLKGLRGKGGYIAHHGDPNAPYTLDYEFEE